MPWSLAAQASGSLKPKRRRNQRDRERDAQRASKAERGYNAEYQRQRRKAILRDGKRCQMCGDDGFLVAHHINHDASDHRLENLQTLCRKCHERHHGRG